MSTLVMPPLAEIPGGQDFINEVCQPGSGQATCCFLGKGHVHKLTEEEDAPYNLGYGCSKTSGQKVGTVACSENCSGSPDFVVIHSKR